MDFNDKKPSNLSSRGDYFTGSFPIRMKYLGAQNELRKNQYHHETNPTGGIPMGIAENTLCNDILVDRLNRCRPLLKDSGVLNYSDPTGMPCLKSSLASFMSRHICVETNVSPDNIVICPGATAILQSLSLMLFESGDSILIPTPYYPTFDIDFLNIGRVQPIEIRLPTLSPEITTNHLNDAYTRAMDENHPPKAVLITNPNNPSGYIYSREELERILNWCREHKLHLIVDEIYALSTFTNANIRRKFVSITTILDGNLNDDVHLIWALSKDFGASGLRMGALYTQNTALLSAYSLCNISFQVSNYIQIAMSEILADEDFITDFFKENATRLENSYAILNNALISMNISFIHNSAAIFVFADFRSILRSQSWESEREMIANLAARGLSVTPGEACHAQEPGFVRICYAFITVEALEEALKRIHSYVTDVRAKCIIA
eukprot:gene1430-2748_t